MQSKAQTVPEYLNGLPDNRKKIMVALRNAIKQNIPKGFEETMSYGMIGYVVPHKLYPDGYHCTPELPLPFISLASQKNYISIYHMGLYGDLLHWFLEEWKEHSTQKLDMGKCCIRFKKPEDVPVELVEKLAGKMTPQQWIAQYESAIKSPSKSKKK